MIAVYYKRHACIIIALSVLVSSCAPSLRKVGRKQGCEIAEEHLQAYILRDIKAARFRHNLPYRAALLPLSLTVGFFLNYFGQLVMAVPAMQSRAGSSTSSSKSSVSSKMPMIKALFLQGAATYSPLKGRNLDRLDDSVIAKADFDVGRCYYDAENYSQATTYFEELLNSSYSQYVGEENLLFLLGDCYYMLSIYDRSISNYRRFLEYCSSRDERIPLVESRIKTIDALHKKGLWGFEKEEPEENEQQDEQQPEEEQP